LGREVEIYANRFEASFCDAMPLVAQRI
jgi:hypothetical protein